MREKRRSGAMVFQYFKAQVNAVFGMVEPKFPKAGKVKKNVRK